MTKIVVTRGTNMINSESSLYLYQQQQFLQFLLRRTILLKDTHMEKAP